LLPSQPKTAFLARRRQQQAYPCPPIILWHAASEQDQSQDYASYAGQLMIKLGS
jgi:hypothetical protein